MPPVGDYVGVGALAAVCTYLGLFPVRRYATRIGFVAEPDERRIHTRVTPLGGGAAMFVALLVSIGVAALLTPLRSVFAGSSEPLGLVLGALVIFAVGLIDDFREMSAPAKMAGQVLAAMLLVFMGVTMFQFKIPFVGFLVLSPQVTPLLTALWVIVITNAVNLIDGLDGLAAGVVAIAAGALAVYGLRLVDLGVLPPDNIGPLVAVVTCGVCLGFLPHNVHVAKVFMGDAGALLLGLLMAAATMVIGGRTPEYSGQSYFFFAPLFIPLFILGVPIADMLFAFVRRTARGTSFHTPDKDHLHHRLLRLGHGPRRTVLILWAWTAVLSGLVLYPLFGGGNGVVPFVVVALALALYTLFHPGLRKSGNGTEEPVKSGPARNRATKEPPPVLAADGPDDVPEGAPRTAEQPAKVAALIRPDVLDGRRRHPSNGPPQLVVGDSGACSPGFVALRHPPTRRVVARYRDGDQDPRSAVKFVSDQGPGRLPAE
ncbi:MAG TPA: MraY family glycosyltransferase [Acidimicrobiales bacterium]|nr:MraY family glycosyltransferase [Acidimicrobiales bacterium]